jgi:glycosyltransferase involved in cell wall biosynthesis
VEERGEGMKENTAVVSTIYPSPGGVATYFKYLYDEEKKLDNNIIVFADKLDKKIKEDKKIIRCWNPSPKFIYQITKEVINKKIKKVHIQQELHIFGSKFNAFLLPLLILFLRIIGVEVTITLHGVVPLKEVNKEFMKENGYNGNPNIQRFGINFLYSLICLFADKLIVHEKKFKDYLKDYYINSKKVYVIGHGIKPLKELIHKDVSRKKLNIDDKYTFVYLGYVTGYKGIDLLIDALKELKDKDFNFIVVGSKHPRREKDENYMKYYNKIKEYFESDKRCIFFGYVPEKEINYYFRAADCAVFPYTVQIASSGPMALAISNETLVIGSEAFDGVLPKNLIFKKSKKSLIKKLREAKSGKLSKNNQDILNMKKDLAWNNIAKKTLEVLEK